MNETVSPFDTRDRLREADRGLAGDELSATKVRIVGRHQAPSGGNRSMSVARFGPTPM
jgi:hypothetical protein